MAKLEETLAKAVADLEEVAVMAKPRVGSCTRKDGTFVKEHDDDDGDGWAAAAPKRHPSGTEYIYTSSGVVTAIQR